MGKFCTKCGRDLSETNGFCENCDAKQETPKFSNNGVINRAAIKEEAKKRLTGNLWTIWKPILVIYAITFAFSFLLSSLVDQGSSLYAFLNLAFEIAILPMSVGLILYMLKFIRKSDVEINDLVAFYDKRFLLILLVTILIGIFTALWSLLLIIPGIIAALSYSMVNYIIADNRKNDTMAVIKESKRMMYGYKADYFVFNLSFLGWALLCIFIVPLIYVIPYMSVSQALYYEELRTIKEVDVNNK